MSHNPLSAWSAPWLRWLWAAIVLASSALGASAPGIGAGTRPPAETILYTFEGPPNGSKPTDGSYPMSPLVADTGGALYGTTTLGGDDRLCNEQCGTVFKLTKSGAGYTESILYSFQGGNDGAVPVGSVILDGSGNLFGATSSAGSGHCGNHPLGGCGTVYELTPTPSGYVEHLIYTFQGGRDGDYPQSGLVADPEGALYGTTLYGGGTPCAGGQGCGTVYKLTPHGSAYDETIIHRFHGRDGYLPAAGLALDGAGALYGTTMFGGPPPRGTGCGTGGTVFKLTPDGVAYRQRVVHAFQCSPGDGADPVAPVVLDADGELYGTTEYGGSEACNPGCGTIFQLAPTGSRYRERILHGFQGGADGKWPTVGPVLDSRGELFGADGYFGYIYELVPHGTGFRYGVYYPYVYGNGAPAAPLLVDPSGALYGTSLNGGGEPCTCGTVFEIRSASPSGP
jgi:uncharacterized repeat protein (TIGR03803 family)